MASLGVAISEPKSWISQEICEFAKRYIYRGAEVTPFPVSAVVENLGEIPLLVSALVGEQKKGYEPLAGIPDALGELARTLHRRSKDCRNWSKWASDSLSSINFSQGNVEALDFLRSLNHPPGEAEAEVIFLEGERLISAAITKLLGTALRGKGKVQIGDQISDEVDALLDGGTEGVDRATESLIPHLPVVGVLKRMERSLAALERDGFSHLEGTSDFQMVLEEFLANPLQMSSWGLDARSRRARGYSRLARYIRSEIESRVESYSGGTELVSFPPYPVQESIWFCGHHVSGALDVYLVIQEVDGKQFTSSVGVPAGGPAPTTQTSPMIKSVVVLEKSSLGLEETPDQGTGGTG